MHTIGYLALSFNLISSAMKNTLLLRLFACIGNGMYISYGLLIGSPPIFWGGLIALLFHSYHSILIITSNK